MTEPLLTLNYRDHIIEIHQDDDAENPCAEQAWMLGTIACWHDRTTLGHVQLNRHNNSIEEYLSGLGSANRDYVGLPVYLYEHSGMTVSTQPFNCQWDSGQVGVITCSLQRAQDHLTDLPVGSPTTGTSWDDLVIDRSLAPGHKGSHLIALREAALKTLHKEIVLLDDFLTGSFYGWYTLAASREILDSCWGYAPYHSPRESTEWNPYRDGVRDAKAFLDAHITQQERLALAACANI